jgi:hypothetical protein
MIENAGQRLALARLGIWPPASLNSNLNYGVEHAARGIFGRRFPPACRFRADSKAPIARLVNELFKVGTAAFY